jgi:hypothetical protein
LTCKEATLNSDSSSRRKKIFFISAQENRRDNFQMWQPEFENPDVAEPKITRLSCPLSNPELSTLLWPAA